MTVHRVDGGFERRAKLALSWVHLEHALGADHD